MSIVRRDVKIGTIAAIPKDNALTIADGITVNEWLDIGRELEKLGDSSAWWIGDWLAYGGQYRRDYHDALRKVDERWSTARVYRWVSQRVKPANRVPELSWSHHREVARLEEHEQIEILLDAQIHGWTVRDVHNVVAGRLSTRGKPTEPSLSVKATGELYTLCTAEAERVGTDPAQWAQRGLAWLVANGSPHLEDAA